MLIKVTVAYNFRSKLVERLEFITEEDAKEFPLLIFTLYSGSSERYLPGRELEK